ncbi:GDP-mannose 4,6-dehydratase [Flavivirga algicola]|uniref:NAD-dependent epimerase/dehydratase family protein n=1 Tax=Flavivirga algicola TaxID=2729136 RepID=A0ABX1RVE4_9FLAO|nr:GDP-mannose 4,6-dehydratase [Flavivirga algicola]NMH86469.1 NAD-dependent epimerase/dehydratase family protein [Flavivirga algicola]
MKFKNKNVLITGGLGFIGSNLAIKLVELGANITIIDSVIPEYGGNLKNIESIKDRIKINYSDVRDEFSIKHLIKDQDFLFNLAGQTSHIDSMTNPFQDLEINAKSQLSILEACRKNNPNIKIVFASTRQLYGKPQYLPVDENHPIIPVDVNGINKMSGENYHLLYNSIYGIKTCVLRLTNTYGPRLRIKDARQTFLGIWIRNIIEEKPFLIFGDGSQVRDYNYVDDVVDAFILTALSNKTNGNIYNLGSPDPITLKETASLLIEENKKGTYNVIPFPEDRKSIDIGDFYANFNKINQDLGWYPKTSFREGISETLIYYKQNIASYI